MTKQSKILELIGNYYKEIKKLQKERDNNESETVHYYINGKITQLNLVISDLNIFLNENSAPQGNCQ